MFPSIETGGTGSENVSALSQESRARRPSTTCGDKVVKMVATLENLIEESRQSGWAVGNFRVGSGTWPDTLESRLTQEALRSGLSLMENRRGAGPLSVLEPTTKEQAHPASISARVGLNEQPLHTDGAHQIVVPDFVLLWSEQINTTPTLVWKPRRISESIKSGIFIIFSGSERSLVPSHDHKGLRFDPGCMAPGDAFARQLCTYLQNPPPEEVKMISWDKPGKVLLLRNREVLHGRAALSEGDDDRRIQRLTFRRTHS